jgi:HlyD family secretion protein
MKNPRQRLLLLGVLLALAAGLIYAFMPRAIPVDVVTVRRGPLQVTVNDDGQFSRVIIWMDGVNPLT